MTFEKWLGEAYPHLAGPETPDGARVRSVAKAAWDDSRQLAIAAVVFKVAAFKRRAADAAEDTEKAAVRRTIGVLLVELSELE